MTAVSELRAMVDRICRDLADRGVHPDTQRVPDRLLVEAASLMSGIASGLEAAAPMFELVRADDGGRQP